MSHHPEPGQPADSASATPPAIGKRENSQGPSPEELDERDRRLAIYLEGRIERRFTHIIRRESADPYGGLPADDVLDRLDRRFPDVGFAGRMLARVEHEQAHRHERERQELEIERYEAETRRLEIDGQRALQSAAGKRAERALYVLLVVGIICTFTAHEQAGEIVLGTTVVGVIGAFLGQRLLDRPGRK